MAGLRTKVLVSVKDGDRRGAMVALGGSETAIQLVWGAVPRQLMADAAMQVTAEPPSTFVGLPSEGRFEGYIALGGLLPVGAASLELVTLDGQRHVAETGNGVWVAVLPYDEADFRPLRILRDAAGTIVPGPGDRGDEQIGLSEVADACPACGGSAWEQFVRLSDVGAVAAYW